jgi:hypothetical protein
VTRQLGQTLLPPFAGGENSQDALDKWPGNGQVGRLRMIEAEMH